MEPALDSAARLGLVQQRGVDATPVSQSLISRRPGVMGGSFVLRGTRIRASMIRDMLVEFGYSVEAVRKSYPTLSLAHIESARAFRRKGKL